jgi:hypothetical protein
MNQWFDGRATRSSTIHTVLINVACLRVSSIVARHNGWFVIICELPFSLNSLAYSLFEATDFLLSENFERQLFSSQIKENTFVMCYRINPADGY